MLQLTSKDSDQADANSWLHSHVEHLPFGCLPWLTSSSGHSSGLHAARSRPCDWDAPLRARQQGWVHMPVYSVFVQSRRFEMPVPQGKAGTCQQGSVYSVEGQVSPDGCLPIPTTSHPQLFSEQNQARCNLEQSAPPWIQGAWTSGLEGVSMYMSTCPVSAQRQIFKAPISPGVEPTPPAGTHW